MAEEVIEGFDVQITDDVFEYLKIQRGRIADLSSDRVRWTQAYKESLAGDFESLKPWLPSAADRVLDIGSGMGGIDIFLAKHFKQPEIWLLDGDEDSPVMVRHDQPFNCMRTARRFLALNGVSSIVTVSPGTELQPAPCDLIVSLQSWCFHYSPAVYLEWVKKCCRPGTVLILDVRKGYIWWRRDLGAAFEAIGIAKEGEKFDRVVFKARA